MLVLLLTCYDVHRSYSNRTITPSINSTSSSSLTDDDLSLHEDITKVRLPKMKMQMVPTIKFLYCHSSGFVISPTDLQR